MRGAVAVYCMKDSSTTTPIQEIFPNRSCLPLSRGIVALLSHIKMSSSMLQSINKSGNQKKYKLSSSKQKVGRWQI